MYQWIIFLHVVSAFVFFMAHGISIGVALWLRRERQPARLRPLLELSQASKMAVHVSVLLLLLSGIAGGFMGHWWRMGWIWVSLGLLVVVSIGMYSMGSAYFNELRKAVGSRYRQGGKLQPAQEPAAAAELEALLASPRMMVMAVIGLAAMVILIYLMMFKPF
jgi:hypothetical protein